MSTVPIWKIYPRRTRPRSLAGITESSTDPPTHRPTWSVMRSVSDGRWVGVVEGALLQGLAAGGYGDVDSGA